MRIINYRCNCSLKLFVQHKRQGQKHIQSIESVLMKSAAIFIIIIFSLLNFHCGSSSNIEKNKTANETEKTISHKIKPKLDYSGIYLDNPGEHAAIWYFNSKDSVKKLILSLPFNYGILTDNFKLSPSNRFLAFYDYDSSNNKTNVYSINLDNSDLAWLKSDPGNNGVDLVWANDSLLYCNLNSGDNDSYPREKYTSLINVIKNKAIENFKPIRGNRLIDFINNKYLLFEFYPGSSIYKNHYYLIDKNSNKIFKDFQKEDDSHGLVHFEISPSGKEFFHIPYKVFTNEKGNSIKEEELVVQKIIGSSDESISHTPNGFTNVTWSPDGNVISFLKVGSINYNAATRKYTNIRYLYFYNVITKQLTNLKTYQDESANGIEAKFDIPKTLTNVSTIFNYLDYKWSPSGKYLFINRQDLTMNSAVTKSILYDINSKTEKTLINNSDSNVKVDGWWNDKLILLSEGNKHILYDLKINKNTDIPFNGRILYLKEE